MNLNFLGWNLLFTENFKQCRFMFEQAHTWRLGIDPFCRYLVPKDKGPPFCDIVSRYSLLSKYERMMLY